MKRFLPLLVLPLACGDDPSLGSSDAGSSSSGAAESEATSSDSTAMDSASVDESGSTGGTPPCESDAACAADTPFCVAGACVPCSQTLAPDAACSELSPSTPICEASLCVACTADNPGACEGTTPVCDTATNTCNACRFHEDCPQSACHIATGECFPTNIVEFDDPPGDLQSVVDLVAPGERLVVRIGGGGALSDAVTVEDAKVIAFVRTPGSTWIWQPPPGAPTVHVADTDTIVYLDNIDISFNGGDLGVEAILTGTVYMDRTRVVGNGGGGVFVGSGAGLFARTCFLQAPSNDHVVRAFTGGTFDIVYSTLAAGLGDSTAITCEDGTGSRVRNSIIVTLGNPDVVSCPGAEISNSAMSDDTLFEGSGNLTVGVPIISGNDRWFGDYEQGDLTLFAGHPFGESAIWETGDPPTDIAGALRPDADLDADFPGADLP